MKNQTRNRTMRFTTCALLLIMGSRLAGAQTLSDPSALVPDDSNPPTAVTATDRTHHSASDVPPDFATQIRPILSNSCFHCHGPDSQTREAELRLDTQEGLFERRDSGVIVMPGHADQSELMRRILSDDDDVRMPPAESNKSLTAEQQQLLKRWVNSGANWTQHWAFVVPVKPDVPDVPNLDTHHSSDAAVNPIDAFLWRAQQQHNLQPSRPADVMTLIRRLYLDLIGRPPSVQEADRWAARLTTDSANVSGDGGPSINESQWQELITELQSMSEYGERWARRWLDLARYADTNGYEKDRPRSIWPYRDWVIEAIQNDMPFDQFTIEQLAGDMLPDASLSQRVATGFHRNTMLNEEGGIDPLEFRFHAMTDRVATTGTTWLGLTTGCAQCHTHKYDPLTHSEYFQLMAFFNNADEPTLELPDDNVQRTWQNNQKRADELQNQLPEKWPVPDTQDIDFQIVRAEISDLPPVIVSAELGETQNAEAISEQPSDPARQTSDETRPAAVAQAEHPAPADSTISQTADQWLVPAKLDVETATYIVEFTVADDQFDSVRLQFRKGVGQAGPGHSSSGNFVLSEIMFEVLANSDESNEKSSGANPGADAKASHQWTRLPVQSARTSVQQPGFELKKAFDGDPATGWGLHAKKGIPDLADATFVLDTSPLNAVLQNTGTKPADSSGKLSSTDNSGSSGSGNSAAQGDSVADVADQLLNSKAASPIRLRVTLAQLHGLHHTIGEFRLQPSRALTPEQLEQRRSDRRHAAFDEWLQNERANAVSWTHLKPASVKSSLPILTIEAEETIFASGDTAKRDDYFVTFSPFDQPITSLRLEALPDERLPARGPGSTYYEGTLGDFYLTELRATSELGSHGFLSASETYSKNRFGNNAANAALAIDGDIQTGWSVHDRQGERHVAVFNLAAPIPAGTPITVHMSFGRHFASSLGRFRFSATSADHATSARDYSASVEQLLQLPADGLTQEDRDRLFAQFLLSAPELSTEVAKIQALRKRPETPSTLVFTERPADHPRQTHRHHRGEYLQAEEEVTARTPEVLHAWPEELPRDRLGFAKWLVRPENPLTARVVVNRHWAAFFGRGIVPTLDDFGLQGTPPDHPELLDWLATTFMHDDDWSVKALHRRIVSSATYRQASTFRTDAAAVDPENRLLTTMPRLRLEAEIVRDSLLQAAGVLSSRRGGAPVHPLQPDGITEVAFGSPRWTPDTGEDRYRRSIYTMIKRTAPFAMITTFDGPSGEACVAQRNRSNTPLQALTLLNDIMVFDLARGAADNLLKRTDLNNDAQRCTQLFRQALTRFPDATERQQLVQFVTQRRAEFVTDPDLAAALISGAELSNTKGADAKASAAFPDGVTAEELAVWLTLSRAVFALDELVTRP